MKKSLKISAAEWQVMEVVWKKSPIAAAEVIAELTEATGWKPNTVRTMLARLVKKRALTYKAEGNRFFYRPAIARDEGVRGESESFLLKAFGGGAKALLAHFVSNARLSAADIRELKEMLDEKARRIN